MMPDLKLFVSYKRQDVRCEDILNKLRTVSKEEGFATQLDVDIEVGEQWAKKIDEMIQAASAVILLMTSASLKSPYVIYEFGYALGQKKPIIPILLEKITYPRKDPHEHYRQSYLAALQQLDFRRNDNWDGLRSKLKSLRSEIEAQLATQQASVAPTPSSDAALSTAIINILKDSQSRPTIKDLLFGLAVRDVLSDQNFGQISKALFELDKRLKERHKPS